MFQKQALEKGLPRTAGVLTAYKGAKVGATAGILTGAFSYALSGGDMGEINFSSPKAISLMAAPSLVWASMLGTVGYLVGYGGSNLLLNAFPNLKSRQFYLTQAGKKPQACLFLACSFLDAITAMTSRLIQGSSESSTMTRKP